VTEQVMVDRMLEGKHFSNKSLVGSRLSVEEVMIEIEKDIIFFQESGGGVTFSGGEPLMQTEFLTEVLEECKKKGIHTALDTCGYAEPAAIDKVIDLVDLWLFDLKVMEDVRHIEFTGQSNELILKNLARLIVQGKKVTARLPVVPDTTDTPANIVAISRFMKAVGLRHIDLLPYHTIAREKYRKLGKEFLMKDIREPDKKTLALLRKYFEEEGFEVG